MGNQAIALGAIRAGVRLACGYPGTPSTEVLETIAAQKPQGVHVEWSVNEKSALEVAAGAAYAGARSIVTMKQVGLNVASDPLMSLAYVGIKGGMVVLVADDPGPISSQTEQDTRTFAYYSKLPVFDPSTPEEAYEMIADAFECSEKYGVPVLFRPTTRLCHACAAVEEKPALELAEPEGFVKDSSRWVIFPRLSYAKHAAMPERDAKISQDFSNYSANICTIRGRKGVITGGVNWCYTQEALALIGCEEASVLRIATPHPFPKELAMRFLESVDEVIAIEELDPVLERELLMLCGESGKQVKILGKLSGDVKAAGENSCEYVAQVLAKFFGLALPVTVQNEDMPPLPIRPPVLCAGCPHRASFYAVKQAMKGRKAVFSGDIGCYTLGNAMPLDMVDTCLCMGAGITVAQGLHAIEEDAVNFAFVGDSTFFHTGIPGIINAVYNNNRIVVVVLDNSTTAMTGHQPHPGTGFSATGEVAHKISIPDVLTAIGVEHIEQADPLRLDEAIAAIKRAADAPAVSAVIFKSPCIAVVKPDAALSVDSGKCIKCKKCIRELGCPAIVRDGDGVAIDASLCTGCRLCTQVCPTDAIVCQ